MDITLKMRELIDKIKIHNYNYYVLDNPTISDKEHDELYYTLVDMENSSIQDALNSVPLSGKTTIPE